MDKTKDKKELSCGAGFLAARPGNVLAETEPLAEALEEPPLTAGLEVVEGETAGDTTTDVETATDVEVTGGVIDTVTV